LAKNSFWGLLSTILQTLFLSIFFVIISRHYSTSEFANYLIATTIYQFMLAISSMGLGTWFIREFGHSGTDNPGLISRFIKIQIFLGFCFYVFNILFALILYSNIEVRLLSLILGANLIFDNIIYALTSLNIAQFKQKRTAIIMAVDALIRLILVCLLSISPFSIVFLSLLLVVVRLVTVNMFIRIGVTQAIGLRYLWNYKISFSDIKKQILPNWRFVIIVALSVIYWRSATIIISKFLTATDVTYYEIAYKILSIFTMIPLAASATIYPKFVKLYVQNDFPAIRKLYRLIFWGFTILSVISYAFIESYADKIIPLVFGYRYALAGGNLKEMFLTFLVFPTALLQANLIVAIKFEKMDMYFNLISLLIFFISCFFGLYYLRSLSVINYSIFISFFSFHIIQNIFLIKLKISSYRNSLIYYPCLVVFILSYKYLIGTINPSVVFICFVLVLLITILFLYRRSYNER
jgi:O-antigen/teichoic acid export membrane protein